MSTARFSTRTVVVVGALVALLLAGVVSYYASSSPDGLNKVATDQGLGEKEKDHQLDDSPLAESARPAMSSVRQPIEEMGREMTRLLLQSIRRPGEPPRPEILDTKLVVRQTSAPR